MGKQAKQSKPSRGGGKVKGSAKPTPYTKPKVEVRFEKDGNSSTPAKAKPSKPSNPPPSQSKGKGKAPEPAPTPIAETEIISTVPVSQPISRISSSSFVVIAGSYEKLLYGIEGSYPPSSSLNPDFKPVFIFPAHLACVKAVAASPGGKWLATGSEDEFVKVWDLRRRKEVGSLSQHTGK
jgi:protein MAK11